MPDWNKSQRMQIKAVLCLVGIGLIILIAFSLVLAKSGSGEKKKKGEMPPQASVTEELYNVYITEAADTYIGVFDGENRRYPYSGDGVDSNITDSFAFYAGQLADLTLTDGAVSRIFVKTGERVSGKVISVEAEKGVVLENLGLVPFDENVRFYMLYGELRAGTERDIRIGYSYADFVMEDGKICGVLMTRDETMQYIRVQIKNSDYAGSYHEAVTLSCDAAYTIYYGEPMAGEVSAGDADVPNTAGREEHAAGESIEITAGSHYFSGENGGSRIYVIPSSLTAKISLSSVNRSQGTPAYRGTMEISLTENGLVVINEVLLEEYLYAVVPSEMPAGYPLEALKAQAICARTYAYSHMLSPGLPDVGAHVDDSTGYQVYNNIMEQSATTTAVKETAGQLLYYEGMLASTYYYSTSCGFGSDEHVWRSQTALELFYLTARSVSREGYEGLESVYTAESMRDEAVFAQFLETPPETDFEKEEPWYRWSYEVSQIDSKKILQILQNRYAANRLQVLTLSGGEYVSQKPAELGAIKKIEIVSRNAGGVAEELVIEGEKATYKVITELNIRYVLCDGVTKVYRQDGSSVEMKSLLPSGFFTISTVQENGNVVGYKLSGGGFGHGAGMSQNGAKNMAEAGYTAQQILEFFYGGCQVY